MLIITIENSIKFMFCLFDGKIRVFLFKYNCVQQITIIFPSFPDIFSGKEGIIFLNICSRREGASPTTELLLIPVANWHGLKEVVKTYFPPLSTTCVLPSLLPGLFFPVQRAEVKVQVNNNTDTIGQQFSRGY